jgi:hypothetical protein
MFSVGGELEGDELDISLPSPVSVVLPAVTIHTNSLSLFLSLSLSLFNRGTFSLWS